jgi:hypothetical protein
MDLEVGKIKDSRSSLIISHASKRINQSLEKPVSADALAETKLAKNLKLGQVYVSAQWE